MSCKHPLKAWQVGFHESGKPKYLITSYNVNYLWKSQYMKTWEQVFDEYPPVEVVNSMRSHGDKFKTDFIEIPCGHCISCRLKQSRDWANRCMLEAQEHESNYFVTLTYNDENLPEPNLIIDEITGECIESPVNPLKKRDVQLFMKRLRKAVAPDKIRFYGCGEYGSESMRPHYHLILFGLKLDDLEVIGKNALGHNYYVSKTIEECWYNENTRESLGFHTVATVSWETCAYTARYCTKKLNGSSSQVYEFYNYPPEFSLCSRKPGIARNYYDSKCKEIYSTDELIIPRGTDKSILAKPPKYFDRLFDIEYPEEYNVVREQRRKIAEENNKNKMSLTSLSYLEQLQVEEDNLVARLKSLQRNL